MNKGSHIPVQLKVSKYVRSTLVIENNAESKAVAKELMCKMMGVKTGKLTMGRPMSAAEAMAYNEGFGEGVASGNGKGLKVIDAPDLVAENGDMLVTSVKTWNENRTKKRAKKESE